MKWTTMNVMATGLALCLASVLMAQQPGGRGRGGPGGFGGGGFGAFGGGGNAFLLMDENVRKELKVTDDQIQRLQEGQQKLGEEMRSLFQGGQDLSDDERRTRFQEMGRKMQDAQKKLEEQVLSATQRERLKQLGVQSRVNRGGVGEALASDELAKDLGLSEADKENIRKAAEQAQQEMRDKIQKLQDEAREKVIASLTPAQQAKLKQLMGEKFEFANNFGGFGGFGGGGAGGRGGFGGGGRGGPGGPAGRGGPPARPPVERLPDGD